MTNAATALADLLEEWKIPGRTSPEDARREYLDFNESAESFWRRQARAVELLREVEQSLNAMEQSGRDVSDHRRHLPAWYKAVFGYDPRWGSKEPKNRPALRSHPMESLRTFGRWLSDVDVSRSLTKGDVAELRNALGEARSVLGGLEEELDIHTRVYLHRLISEALQCVDELQTFGEARARTLTTTIAVELNTVRTAADRRGNAETGKKLGQLVSRLGRWLSVTAAAGVLQYFTGLGIEALPEVAEYSNALSGGDQSSDALPPR